MVGSIYGSVIHVGTALPLVGLPAICLWGVG